MDVQVFEIRRVCNRYEVHWRDVGIPKEIPASRNWSTGIMTKSRWWETGIPPRFTTLPFAKNASLLSNQIASIHSNSYASHVVQIWRMSVAYMRRNSPSKLLTGRRVRILGCPNLKIPASDDQRWVWHDLKTAQHPLIFVKLLLFIWFRNSSIALLWRHQMETFSAFLSLCEGNPPVTGGFPHKGQWRGALMFSLNCAWIGGWANNWDAGDL